MNLNFTLHPDGRVEQVYPCRCGETHRGDYAVHDYRHHECFHDAPLWDIGHGMLMCSDCGKTWAAPEPMLGWVAP